MHVIKLLYFLTLRVYKLFHDFNILIFSGSSMDAVIGNILSCLCHMWLAGLKSRITFFLSFSMPWQISMLTKLLKEYRGLESHCTRTLGLVLSLSPL